MALWSSTAATVESTPPLRPRITGSFPSLRCSSSTVVSMNEAGVQLPLQPQIVLTKLARMRLPYSV